MILSTIRCILPNAPNAGLSIETVTKLNCPCQPTSTPTGQPSDSKEWSWQIAKNLPEGSYTGEWSNSIGRHGWGTMEYNANVQDFDKYEGGWDENRHHGWGCMEYKRNNANHWSEYTGGWDENKKHGYGRMIYSDGSTYVGGWNNDERHGYGVYHYTTIQGIQVTFRGCFKLDEKYEGTITGKTSSGISLEYFGRFRENMFDDRSAFVLIGGHPSYREYRADSWKHHGKDGSKPNDELDCLKGERTR